MYKLKKTDKKIIDLVSDENGEDLEEYKAIREEIKKKYIDRKIHLDLDKFNLEKERVKYRIESLNSQYIAVSFSVLVMVVTIITTTLISDIENAGGNIIVKVIGVIPIVAILLIVKKVIVKVNSKYEVLTIAKIVLDEIELNHFKDHDNQLEMIKNDIERVRYFMGVK